VGDQHVGRRRTLGSLALVKDESGEQIVRSLLPAVETVLGLSTSESAS
jgi:hypothetical protein